MPGRCAEDIGPLGPFTFGLAPKIFVIPLQGVGLLYMQEHLQSLTPSIEQAAQRDKTTIKGHTLLGGGGE
jgi:hypothetical protein